MWRIGVPYPSSWRVPRETARLCGIYDMIYSALKKEAQYASDVFDVVRRADGSGSGGSRICDPQEKSVRDGRRLKKWPAVIHGAMRTMPRDQRRGRQRRGAGAAAIAACAGRR